MTTSGQSPSGKRLLIVGWDGADWDILDELMARGTLPCVESMVQKGSRGILESVIPSHSWAAWPTFLTGMDPAGHGVFDFVERDPSNPGRRVPVTSGSIRSTTFLELLSDAGLEVRVGNVPVAFPPIPVKGRMISGVAVPPGAEYVFPASWRRELDQLAPFPINGLEWAHAQDDPEGLLSEARSLVQQRTKSFELLLEGDWDAAVCIYVEPDRIQHALGAFVLPAHPDYDQLSGTKLGEEIRDFYRLLDKSTERLIEKAGTNTTVILMSDHGFRPITRQLDLNGLLKSLGFAHAARSAEATSALRRSFAARALKATRIAAPMRRRVRMPSTLDWSRTRAYKSTTGGGISLNLKGREPHGIVDPRDYETVRSELATALVDFVDPETGDHPIAETYARESLYDGAYLDLAPDLFVRGSALWGMSTGGSDHKSLSSSTSWPTGRHRRSGILVASGPNITSGQLGTQHLRDLAPTALGLFNLRAEGLDGRPIDEITGVHGDEVLIQGADRPRERVELTVDENEQIASHLRDLGYIE